MDGLFPLAAALILVAAVGSRRLPRWAAVVAAAFVLTALNFWEGGQHPEAPAPILVLLLLLLFKFVHERKSAQFGRASLAVELSLGAALGSSYAALS